MSPVTFPSDMSGAHHTHHTADISPSATQTNSGTKKQSLLSQGKARKAAGKLAESDHHGL